MPKDPEKKIFTKFIISVTLTFILCLTGIFLVVSVTTKKLIAEVAKTEARTLFNSIVMTRKWNASYGGVYVEKKPGVESNPYLENPDIRIVDGRVFTKINPALMTRQISEFAGREGLFTFHITSLNLLNPNNKPDAFETEALQRFVRGEMEVFREERINGRNYFRYMAPLHISKECLQCHAKQGYTIGDIRGGISVTFDIHDILKMQKDSSKRIILLAVFSISALLGVIYFFTFRLTKKLSETRRQIREMAITDPLTGLYNRRHVMERFNNEMERARRLRKDLSCIMIDIDNFKRINDTYGHLVGDQTLREISEILTSAIRVYDIASRYGGEEFLIVLPDTGFEDTHTLAERIRTNIKMHHVAKSALTPDISVTVSLGIATIISTDISVDTLLKRADEGLYKAKERGRDTVAWV
ncbi:MAG: diguanylate cyclase [Nitrospiraceae bacterium]|jgi:diguanylate cyclase (GGDEF)-like protein|nr:MAG: diguanylate cyclase [Nitrospiraceae bacterium]